MGTNHFLQYKLLSSIKIGRTSLDKARLVSGHMGLDRSCELTQIDVQFMGDMEAAL
jgi:hypothetical protein